MRSRQEKFDEGIKAQTDRIFLGLIMHHHGTVCSSVYSVFYFYFYFIFIFFFKYSSIFLIFQGSVSVSMFVWDIDLRRHDTMGQKKSKTYTHTADKNDAMSLWQPFDFTWHHNSGGTLK